MSSAVTGSNSLFAESKSVQRENRQTVSSRIETTLEPCVVLMKSLIAQYAHLWDDETKGGIYSLAQGIVYWKPPPTVYDQIQSRTDDIHLYNPADGLPEFTSALKEKVKEENGLEEVNVMVTAGANQAFVNCALTMLGEGESCVIFAPYYFNHVMALQMSRGEESVAIGPTVHNSGIPDLAWLKSKLENNSNAENPIKMVTLVNPGNPTGVSLTRDQIQEFVALCRDHKVWLVVDNTYEHFDHIHANSSDEDNIPFWCSSEDHVVNIFTFSKGYSMAGFRVGYLTISTNGLGPFLFQQMLKVQDTIPICVSRISQIAAMGALQSGQNWVKEQVKTLDIGRKAILDALEPLEAIMGGTGAMYVMAKLPQSMDDQEVARTLVKEFGIAIIPGSFCGFPGWIRVCYSNLPPDDCLIAAERLKDGIETIMDRFASGLSPSGE